MLTREFLFLPRLLFLAFSLLLFATASKGQIPQLISYQGRVMAGGANFNGSGRFKFALVNASGSTSFWSNDGSSANGGEPLAAFSLPVSQGLFTVLLGDATLANMTVIPATVFNNPEVFLRVWFDGGEGVFQQLSPDQRVAAVGYAMMAANVPNGVITSAKLAPNAVTAANISDGAIGASQLAAGSVTAAKLGAGAAASNLQADGMTALPYAIGKTNLTEADYLIINKSAGGGWETRQTPAASLLNLAGVVNVKAHGVKGDGSTDDSAALQAIIDDKSGAGVVNTFYFPPGTYRLTLPLKIRRENTRIVGAGPELTTIKQTGANQRGLVIAPTAGNWGGTNNMWNSYFEGFTVIGPGRTNTTAEGIYFGDLDTPGTYFADGIKLFRVRVGNSWATSFPIGLSISNCVSVIAEGCEFKYCTESVRLSHCDSAWFVECQTGYTGIDSQLFLRDDPATMCFNVLDGGLGTHIMGGEHGHMFRFMNVAAGSVVTVIGGNFENFANCAYSATNSYLTVINPRMLLVNSSVPIYRLQSGAGKCNIIGGHYGWCTVPFVLGTAGETPSYAGMALNSTNAASGGGLRRLPAVAIPETTTNLAFVQSNSVSLWPAAPRYAGEAFFGNSNGVIYLVSSGRGLTWTGTNKLSSP